MPTDFRTIWTTDDHFVEVIDQRLLPHQFVVVKLLTYTDAVIAIKNMTVRGAPLIGATAAYGVYLAVKEMQEKQLPSSFLQNAFIELRASRPTAINLFWALDRMQKVLSKAENLLETAWNEAHSIVEEDIETCRMIGVHGLELISAISKKKKGETEQRADSIANSELLKYYIESHSKWKQLARQKLARGEFPGDPDMTGTLPEKHGGLVFRPVDKRENYIKRCVGIPGDKMKVEASVLYVNGKKAFVSENQCLQYKVPKKSILFPTATEMYERYKLENDPNGSRTDFNEENPEFYLLTLTKSEKRLIEKDFKINMEIYRTPRYSVRPEYIPNAMELIENASVFPKDFFINNTTTDFQEFQVPAKGQTIKISKDNIAWYRRIITAYEGHKLEERKDGSILIDGKKVTTYTFSMNYYWLMGDNRYNSADSRIWGFVPEDHVVGRASLVWFSKSSYLGIRVDRIFKFIH